MCVQCSLTAALGTVKGMRTQPARSHEGSSTVVLVEPTQNEVEGRLPSGAFHLLAIDRGKQIYQKKLSTQCLRELYH